MAKCDLCERDCKAPEMQQLLSCYQATGLTDICPECARWATTLKHQHMEDATRRTAQVLKNTRDAIRSGKRPPMITQPSWMRRVVCWFAGGCTMSKVYDGAGNVTGGRCIRCTREVRRGIDIHPMPACNPPRSP